ncbi:MAG: mannosyltransferase family protein [Microgenomates group bacterium]|jgi:hypothetical protein
MIKSYIPKIILIFAFWRIALFVVAFLALFAFPVFGNRFPYWDMLLSTTGLPSWIWGFGSFDGVHYLRIVTMGYESSQYSQAFFPLFPLFIKMVTLYSGNFLVGLIFTNLVFLMALIVFYKLVELDYNHKTALLSIILLLVFPTSFYFGSLYSESLFLFFTVSTVYLLRKKNYLAAGVYGLLACSTRIIGLWLIPLFLTEIFFEYKGTKVDKGTSTKIIFGLFLIPLGVFLYMLYLGFNFNDPILFLSSQPAFGAQRSSFIVTTPQVFFRYIKILLTVPVNSTLFFNGFLEFCFTLISLIFLIIAYGKTRLSYWVFSFGCWLTPTLTGTFSSMPRYILMMFLLLPLIAKINSKYFILLVTLFIILGMLLTALFTRGYWVA